MKSISFIFTIFIFCTLQTATAQKNILQLGVGIGGQDGIEELGIYEIAYKRKLTKVISATVQYATMAGSEKGIASDDQVFAGTRYLGPNHSSTNGVQDIGSSTSFYLGVELGLVRTTNTTLYVVGGTRLTSLTRVKTIGGGSRADDLVRDHYGSTHISPELGVGYERRFTKNYSVGGKFIIGPTTSFFAASLTSGVYF